MGNCRFSILSDNNNGRRFVCRVCKRPTAHTHDQPPRRNCPNAPDVQEAQAEAAEKLGVSIEEVRHWGSYVVQWVAMGCPTRTEAEVAACLAVCHDDCEHFRTGRPPADPDNPPSWLARITEGLVFWRKNGYCSECGCGVSSPLAVFNMARMLVPGLGCKYGKWPE